MAQKYSVSICSVSNLTFNAPPSANTKKSKTMSIRQKKITNNDINNPSTIRKHLESFIPTSCYSEKKNFAINFKTNRRQIKPLQGMQITYKRFPVRKQMTASCVNFTKRQKNFHLGPEQSCFSNKFINQLLLQSSIRNESKSLDNLNHSGISYKAKRKSLPTNYQANFTHF